MADVQGRQWMASLKRWKKNNCQWRILHPVKLFFKPKSETKAFLDKQTLKECVALEHEMLKEVLQFEGKWPSWKVGKSIGQKRGVPKMVKWGKYKNNIVKNF